MIASIYFAWVNFDFHGPSRRSRSGASSPCVPTWLCEKRPFRLLYSYHFFHKQDLDELLKPFDHLPRLELFLDSGAFSAFTLGAKIDLNAYIDYCAKWKHRLTVIAGLDVIGSGEGTRRNTDEMRRQLGDDVPILPAFHVGEPFEVLDDYVARYPYIALGGMVPYIRHGASVLPGWLRACFERIPSTTKVHGFGLTQSRLMLAFPFHSVDSSSWAAGIRFSELVLFDDQTKRWTQVSFRDPKAVLRSRDLLLRYDLDPRTVRTIQWRDNVRLAMVAWARFQDWIETREGRECTTTSR